MRHAPLCHLVHEFRILDRGGMGKLDVMENIGREPKLKNLVKGFMLESFLKTGSQKLDVNNPGTLDRNGLSITDPCLGWDETEKLLLALSEKS